MTDKSGLNFGKSCFVFIFAKKNTFYDLQKAT